jgi:NADPH:quinone reductase
MLANVPATQTVIEIKAPGESEMLVPATRPVPEPKAGEVLIRIAAAGVNRADCLQRMGRYPMPPGGEHRRRGFTVAGRRPGLRAAHR